MLKKIVVNSLNSLSLFNQAAIDTDTKPVVGCGGQVGEWHRMAQNKLVRFVALIQKYAFLNHCQSYGCPFPTNTLTSFNT